MITTGCAKAKAASDPAGPPLSVPAPPPRVLAPVEEAPLADNPPAPEEPATPPRTTQPRPTPPPRRPPATATTEPKPEPSAEVPVTPPAVVEAPPVVRPATQADAAAERKVREVLQRASNDLKKVTYQRLSVEGKQQYDASRRFIEQGEQALKDRNYVFASTVADKAAGLASELQGR